MVALSMYFSSLIFSRHTASFEVQISKVQDFGECSPDHVVLILSTALYP